VSLDPASRIATRDEGWGGPYPRLYDDGPWTAGGHEPAGAVAGDHRWGVTVFIKPPATGIAQYEYGLVDRTGAGQTGPWKLTKVTLKASAWGWYELELKDDGALGDAKAGDGIYTFLLSEYVGAGRKLTNSGLLRSGETLEFMFVVGRREYKLAGVPALEGVAAAARPRGARAFSAIPVIAAQSTPRPTLNPGNRNAAVTAP
jgi:hypothetical protein